MTHILVINVHSAKNAGDEALTRVTITQLKNHFTDGHLTLMMDEPVVPKGKGDRIVGSMFTWLKGIAEEGAPSWRKLNLFWLLPGSLLPVLTYRWFGKPFYGITPSNLQPTIQSYIEADLVVNVAGGFLYSSGSGLTLAIKVFTLLLAILAGKPLYIFPLSLGPLRRFWEPSIIRWIMMRARIVMVREPESQQVLAACKVSNPRTYLLPDPAFAFDEIDPGQLETWSRSLKLHENPDQPLLGITAMNWEAQKPDFRGQSRYEAALAAAARYFIQQLGGRTFLFTQVWGPTASQDDRVPAQRVAALLMDLGDHIFLVDQPTPPDFLRGMYGLMDLFIGTRMHSNIFALSQGVPVLAIAYQPKTTGILRMIGLDHWVVDIDNVDEQSLTKGLGELWTQRADVRDQLQKTLPGIIDQASLPGSLIFTDYMSYRREMAREPTDTRR